MDTRFLALYFVIGGAAVTLITYFGSQGKGTLAAFIALFPSITVITLLTIYFNGGLAPATSYFKGLLFMLPAWLLYVIPVLFLLPRIGMLPALLIGIGLYVGASWLIMRFIQ